MRITTPITSTDRLLSVFEDFQMRIETLEVLASQVSINGPDAKARALADFAQYLYEDWQDLRESVEAWDVQVQIANVVEA